MSVQVVHAVGKAEEVESTMAAMLVRRRHVARRAVLAQS